MSTTRICILDTNTQKCINVHYLKNISDWNDHAHFARAPQDDGEVGWTWNGSGWDTHEKVETLEEKKNKERARRDKYLNLYIDKLNGPRWDSMTQEQKDALIQYRQDLLDVPQQEGFPESIVWPVPPV